MTANPKLCEVCHTPLPVFKPRGVDPRRTHKGACQVALQKKEKRGWFGKADVNYAE